MCEHNMKRENCKQCRPAKDGSDRSAASMSNAGTLSRKAQPAEQLPVDDGEGLLVGGRTKTFTKAFNAEVALREKLSKVRVFDGIAPDSRGEAEVTTLALGVEVALGVEGAGAANGLGATTDAMQVEPPAVSIAANGVLVQGTSPQACVQTPEHDPMDDEGELRPARERGVKGGVGWGGGGEGT